MPQCVGKMHNCMLIEKEIRKIKDGIISFPHSAYQVGCQSADREFRAVPNP